MSSMKKIYLVRHGQTNANLKRYLGGRDELLNDTGKQQAITVGKRLQALQVDSLLASDWPRAQQTAQCISDEINLDIETVPELGEHMPPLSLANLSYDDPAYDAYKDLIKQHWGGAESQAEGAENFHSLFARSEQLRKHLESHTGTNIVAVSHSRFLRFFTAYMTMRDTLTPDAELHMSTVLRPKNTSITAFTFDHKNWQLVTWNDHAHFAE